MTLVGNTNTYIFDAEITEPGNATVGFVLSPVSVTQLKSVADQEGIMPPKSTYIEPKLRSGLVIYPINYGF
jgi:uncharacterized protein (DUF1015 family)